MREKGFLISHNIQTYMVTLYAICNELSLMLYFCVVFRVIMLRVPV